MRFEGQVAVITGASAGIGEAAARQFAAEGAKVVLAARGAERLEAVAAELPDALPVPTDVGRDADCRALVEAALERYGRLDVLVNNAGLHHRGPFAEHSAEAFAAMVDVNLRAPVLLTRLALPHLQRSATAGGAAAAVQVASLAGCVPVPHSAVYSATKFGLRGFALALAEELRESGVRSCVVSPGPVDTGFIMDDLDTVSDLTLSQPVSTAEEVAAAVLACVADGRPERKLPGRSGVLTTVAYVAPWLGRALRPALERKGRRAKAALRAKSGG